MKNPSEKPKRDHWALIKAGIVLFIIIKVVFWMESNVDDIASAGMTLGTGQCITFDSEAGEATPCDAPAEDAQ
jgi:hypothetical protein